MGQGRALARARPPLRMNSGSVLLSHAVASAVPSGLRSLTAVFGMGTGVASSLRPPERVPGCWQPGMRSRRERATECRRSGNRLVRGSEPPSLTGGLARGKLYDQAERAISNG